MPESVREDFVNNQQSDRDRLNSKLKERLEYSGIYSQRNSRYFFNNLSVFEQQKLCKDFKALYFHIITDYFANESDINEQIDRLVETAFFVNLPMGKVVEIHMELIDDLERQLKLEGLHSEYLSDYRLVLIDVIAHLGEMYRSVLTDKCIVSD